VTGDTKRGIDCGASEKRPVSAPEYKRPDSGALLAFALLPVLRRVTRTLIPSIETLMPSV